MSIKPFFSIVTVTYNDCNNLRQTIDSVLNQENIDYEFVIIDGNSRDCTLELIQKNKENIEDLISSTIDKLV